MHVDDLLDTTMLDAPLGRDLRSVRRPFILHRRGNVGDLLHRSVLKALLRDRFRRADMRVDGFDLGSVGLSAVMLMIPCRQKTRMMMTSVTRGLQLRRVRGLVSTLVLRVLQRSRPWRTITFDLLLRRVVVDVLVRGVVVLALLLGGVLAIVAVGAAAFAEVSAPRTP